MFTGGLNKSQCSELCYFALKRHFTLAKGFIMILRFSIEETLPCKRVWPWLTHVTLCCLMRLPLRLWGLALMLSSGTSYLQEGCLGSQLGKQRRAILCHSLYSNEPT